MIYLTIPQNHADLWVFYFVLNNSGQVVNINIDRFNNMTNLSDVDLKNGSALSVVDQDTDVLKLINRAYNIVNERALTSMQWKVNEISKRIMKPAHGNARPVMCETTGEIFDSVLQCSNEHSVSYAQLNKHLKRMTGYKSVKGKTYRYK